MNAVIEDANHRRKTRIALELYLVLKKGEKFMIELWMRDALDAKGIEQTPDNIKAWYESEDHVEARRLYYSGLGPNAKINPVYENMPDVLCFNTADDILVERYWNYHQADVEWLGEDGMRSIYEMVSNIATDFVGIEHDNVYEYILALELIYVLVGYENMLFPANLPSENRKIIDEWFFGDSDVLLNMNGDWLHEDGIDKKERLYYKAAFYFWQSHPLDAIRLGKEGIYRVMDGSLAFAADWDDEQQSTIDLIQKSLFKSPRFSKYRYAIQLHQTLKRNEREFCIPYIVADARKDGLKGPTLLTPGEREDYEFEWFASDRYQKARRHYYVERGVESGKPYYIYDMFWAHQELIFVNDDEIDAIQESIHSIAVDIEYNTDLHAELIKRFYIGEYPDQSEMPRIRANK